MTNIKGSGDYPVDTTEMDKKGSTGQLYVQVKKRKTRLQYRRNQDAINFLRRFTLAVVIIDLMLAISESNLISTFFLFLTMSTTFEVKPENVIDTYCHHFQGGGNLMCEQYMERVTVSMNTQRVPNSWNGNTGAGPENHFPSQPSRPPLTPSESRKLYQAYNQSLYDFPARLSIRQKLDKNSRLSQTFENLVYLLYSGNDTGTLNKTLLEFLATSNPREKSSTLGKLESLTNQLKQSIELVESGLPSPFNLKRGQCIVFRPTLKSFDGLKPQRLKPKQIRNSVPPLPRKLSPVKPFVQAGNLIQHRWKRSLAGETVPPNKLQISNEIPAGSDGKRRHNGDIHLEKTKTRNVFSVHVGGLPTLKGQHLQDSNFEVDEQSEILEDYAYYDASKTHSQPPPRDESHPGENCKTDFSGILSDAESYLKHLERNNFDWHWNGTRNTFVPNKSKYLQELTLSLDKTPRHIVSLMEASLFNNWEHFNQELQRLSLSYQIDSPHADVDKDDSVVWPAIREKIIQNLLFYSEMNVFSPEISQRAERRKHAIEQIYHDYSSSILVQLENVKEMPVSRSYLCIYKVIKMYMMLWQSVICLVLLHGSVFEDKTALNIWGILNILTSLLHFMVDDWINTSFQPEKTSASIWFGVIYGIYKPITILLVATLSSEIFRKERANNKGAIARICEIIKGRKRAPLVAEKCLEKLKGVLITADHWVDCDNKKNTSISATATTTGGENNNGSSDNIVYSGIKMVKIRAKIKRMEVNNGNLIVITHTTAVTSGAKNEQCCLICGSPAPKQTDTAVGDDEEKVFEGQLFSPSGEVDNEAGVTVEDLYPEDSDDEDDEDEDELEEVDDDESEEEEDASNEHKLEKVTVLKEHSELRDECSKEDEIAVLAKMEIPSKLAGGKVSADESTKESKSPHLGNPLIGYATNRAKATFLHAQKSGRASDGQGDDLLHGPIVDGGNLHI